MARRLRSEAHAQPTLFDANAKTPALPIAAPVAITPALRPASLESVRAVADAFLSVANVAASVRKPTREGRELERQRVIDGLPDYSTWINIRATTIKLDLSIGDQPRGKFVWMIGSWEYATMRAGNFDELIAREYSAHVMLAPDAFVSLISGGAVADAFMNAPDRGVFAFSLHDAFWHDRIVRFDEHAGAYVFTPRGLALIAQVGGTNT